MSHSVVTPRHAATVILLREAAGGAEALVTRRHQNLAFMGGLWVFPGGTVAAADESGAALARIPLSAEARCRALIDLQGQALPRTQRLGLAVAAARETFEETGVLLATDSSGRHCSDDLWKEVQAQRRAIVADPERFPRMLQQHALQLEIDRLIYWAHWITPSSSPRRFDTRFFAALLPPGQNVTIDETEATDHAWMTPHALLEAVERDAMPLSPPTLYTIMEIAASLARYGSAATMLDAQGARIVPPVLPKVIRIPHPVIVLPWDAEYEALPGEGAPSAIDYPDALRSLPSRTAGK